MQDQAQRHDYRVFGLSIGSEVPAPCLPSRSTGAAPELEIRHGNVPTRLSQERFPKIFVEDGKILLGRVDAGSLLVEDGRSIIASAPPLNPSTLTCLVWGSGLPTALMQQGALVLHAAVFRYGRFAVMLAGTRGAGKSTTAMELRLAGLPLISDDQAVIRGIGSDQLIVHNGLPQQKLHQDSVSHYGIADHVLALPGERGKFSLTIDAPHGENAVSPSIIFTLSVGDVDKPFCTAVNGTEKLRVLKSQLFRPRIAEAIGGYHPLMLKLAEQTAMFRIVRPPSRNTRSEIRQLVMDRLRT